jgi:DNA-binding transcriptional LysR family regulator
MPLPIPLVCNEEAGTVEVHQLRYFCAIAKHGTFTRAAEAEHVAQPSLSQQILKLEDELGGKLFYRLPREAKLTQLGESFLPRALAILQDIHDTKAEAQRIVQTRQAQPELDATVVNNQLNWTQRNRQINGNGTFKLRKSA